MHPCAQMLIPQGSVGLRAGLRGGELLRPGANAHGLDGCGLSHMFLLEMAVSSLSLKKDQTYPGDPCETCCWHPWEKNAG